ncbi:MAG: hypothetical protein SFT90_08110 [Rickettsiales bacterium]|nr:hypothetical protein [Rickettsiales bacterium]
MSENFQDFKKLVDDDLKIVFLITGEDENSSPIFAYVRMKASDYFSFMNNIDNPNGLELSNFGEIVSYGNGEPSKEVKREMFEKYGTSDDFQQNLIDNMLKLNKDLTENF